MAQFTFTNVIDPNETLDFGLDLSDWLETGVTIATGSWTVGSGLTKISQVSTSTKSGVMVTVGSAVVGDIEELVGTITDTDGRILVRRINLYVAER